MKISLVLVSIAVLSGCAKRPTAMEVCKKLEVAGVASGCHEEKPGGLNATAVERIDFALPSVPEKSGSVLRFDKTETFTSTQLAYEKAAFFAGPHRYGSEKNLIFMQMNDGASLEVGRRAKAVIDALPGDSSEPPVSTVPPPAPKAAAPAVVVEPVSASLVCAKLTAAGIAVECEAPERGPLEKVGFKVASLHARHGTVVRPTEGFAKYTAMVNALPPSSALRPFVSSEKLGVVVHFGIGVSPSVVTKAQAVLDAP